MTGMPGESIEPFSPFPEWESVAGRVAPYVGDRALALFVYAISETMDARSAAARIRTRLGSETIDLSRIEVTETERLLIDWGRAIATAPAAVDPAMASRVTAAFRPELRGLLVQLAALTVATGVADLVG
ncbi:hypothetical protein [Galbitalea soli]|uniref:Uncharacterized protein n=1 Tax=Galbitalea soli TaxID=1268042 RepID=A0A7C9TQL1_9MICO|nr:hypothetical protein [Galbitalea soli]NEM90383.1 hypothetical protein [Galbitalea soli]NYJ31093.1 hypothetical protein [Galbitalea soli]